MPPQTSLHAFPALACALALVCALAPVPAAAASPAPSSAGPAVHDEFRPRQMKAAGDGLAVHVAQPASAAPAATAAPAAVARPAVAARPNREVFGFAQWPGLRSGTGAGWDGWNFSLLGTVAYFGVHVNSGDGHLVQSDAGWTGWQSGEVAGMIGAARAAGARVVLTIISQELAGNECNALLHGSTTIAETVAQINGRGVDGVNIDYESANQAPPSTCPGGSDNRTLLRNFVRDMRAALGGRYLTVDTYASSAPDGGGFFDIPGMAPYVDGFFVMAYDLDGTTSGGGNWTHPPLNCSSYCFSPNSPAAGYYYNDDRVLREYIAAAGARKTILGLPYYGYTACVAAGVENAYPAATPHWTTPTYLGSASAVSDPAYAPYNTHRDSHDGSDRWDDFNNNTYGCHRESYWNDATSIGAKYDMVNSYGVLGAGIFSLDYGGSSPELWNQLATHFSNAPAMPVGVRACPGDGFAVVSWTAPSPGAAPITRNVVTASPGGAGVTAGPAANQAVVRGLTDGTPYTLGVQAENVYGRGPAGLSDPVTPVSSAGTWPGQFHTLPPKRVFDTRDGTGGVSGRVQPRQVLTVPMLGQGGIPASGVAGVVLNVTATNTYAPGYLTVFPAGSCQPVVSSLNWGAGQTVPNLVTVPLGAGGAVSFFNGSWNLMDLVADVAGYISTAPVVSGGDGRFQPLTPARILDTRNGTGGKGTLGPGEANAISLQVLGDGVVPPSGVSAVVLNVTAVYPRGGGWLAVYPGATRYPGSSNLNFAGGQIVPNRVVVPVGANGQVQFLSSVTTDVIADIGGWYTDASGAAAGGLFTGTTPVRIVDTRDGTGGFGTLGPGQSIPVQMTGQPGVPASGVKAVVLNVTATNVTAPSFITAYASDGTWPLASDLNTAPGQTSANLVVVRLGVPGGQASFLNAQGYVDLVIDLVGWYG